MGNQLTIDIICSDNILAEEKKSRKKKKKLSWLSHNNKTNKIKNDDFIIQFNKTNNNKINIKSLDPKRVIFISLIGLYNSYKCVPSFVLYSAIFLLPLKRKWVYHPEKYVEEIKSNFISEFNSFSDICAIREFIKLLKWKDAQGLCFWMLSDELENEFESNLLVHPFWSHFNKQLTNLYDPITNNKYNPLDLDEKEWQNKMSNKNKYCTKTVSILSELYFCNAKFQPMQEIIYQSNPNSLLPIISYGSDENIFNQLSKLAQINFVNEFDIDENINDWWISEDYDPYDL